MHRRGSEADSIEGLPLDPITMLAIYLLSE